MSSNCPSRPSSRAVIGAVTSAGSRARSGLSLSRPFSLPIWSLTWSWASFLEPGRFAHRSRMLRWASLRAVRRVLTILFCARRLRVRTRTTRLALRNFLTAVLRFLTVIRSARNCLRARTARFLVRARTFLAFLSRFLIRLCLVTARVNAVWVRVARPWADTHVDAAVVVLLAVAVVG